MSGLSYFSNGGDTDEQAEQPAPASTSTGVQVKPRASKSPYALPPPTGNVEMSQGVLDAMEQLYRKKLEEQTGYESYLKDASAWWSRDPMAKFKRGEERSKESAELFGMQSDIAQFKAAQEAQKAFQKDKARMLGGGGEQPGAGGMGIDLSPEEKLVLSRAKTEADYNKLLQGFVSERTKFANNPSSYNRTIEDVVVGPDGKPRLEMVSPIEMVRKGRMSVGQATQAAAAAPAAAAPAAAAPAAAAPAAAAAAPAAAAPAAAAPAPAAAAPAAAAVGEDQFRFENMTPEQKEIMRSKSAALGLQGDVFARPDAAELFNRQPLEQRRRVFSSLTPEEVPAVAPKAVTPAPAPAPKPAVKPSIPEIKAQMEREKLQTQADIETAKESNKAFETEIRDSASRATDQINTSTEIINLVSKNKNVFGVFKQKPGMASALGTILETGVSAPGGHSIGVPQISEAIVLATPGVTKANIAARDRVENLLNKTALYSSSIIKGQGQVTEYERRLIEQLVGSVRNTPENLIKIQKIMRANAEAAKERERMFGKSGLSAREFRNSQQYLDWKDKYDEKLTSLYNEPLSIQGRETTSGQGTTKSGVKWRVVQ